MQYIWKNRNPKLKHTTLCNEYEQGGLKNLDIFSKITSLKCSLFLIKNHLGRNFVFHSNLSVKQNVAKKSPKFYQEILTRLGKNLSSRIIFLKKNFQTLNWNGNIYMYVYVYIYIYTYICMYIYIYTYIHYLGM